MGKHVLYIVLCVVANFFSQTQFKVVSSSIKGFDLTPETIFDLLFSFAFNFNFWFALIFFGLSSILWIIGIKGTSLSKAFSLLSLNYVLIIVYSWGFLDEVITWNQILSLALILIGVILISFKKREISQKNIALYPLK